MRSFRSLFSAMLLAIGLAGASPAALSPPSAAPLLIEKQGSFFVGGRDIHSDSLTMMKDIPPSGTISVDQVYVRYQIPPKAADRPNLVFIHGCCLTGKTWETTPDGRMGWDEYFVRRGFPTYVIDQAWRGRSATDISAINAVKAGKAKPDQLPEVLAASHEMAWSVFRFGAAYPEVFPGMLFPLEALDEFWKQMVPDWAMDKAIPAATVAGLSELAGRIHRAVLISHSQSGIFPFNAAVKDPRNIAGIVSIEPAECPSPTGDMAPYKSVPIMILFGDYVDRSRWAPRLEECRAFAAAAIKAGVRAEVIVLPEIGIKGNSHMLMQDRNSLELADWLAQWIEKHSPVTR